MRLLTSSGIRTVLTWLILLSVSFFLGLRNSSNENVVKNGDIVSGTYPFHSTSKNIVDADSSTVVEGRSRLSTILDAVRIFQSPSHQGEEEQYVDDKREEEEEEEEEEENKKIGRKQVLERRVRTRRTRHLKSGKSGSGSGSDSGSDSGKGGSKSSKKSKKSKKSRRKYYDYYYDDSNESENSADNDENSPDLNLDEDPSNDASVDDGSTDNNNNGGNSTDVDPSEEDPDEDILELLDDEIADLFDSDEDNDSASSSRSGKSSKKSKSGKSSKKMFRSSSSSSSDRPDRLFVVIVNDFANADADDVMESFGTSRPLDRDITLLLKVPSDTDIYLVEGIVVTLRHRNLISASDFTCPPANFDRQVEDASGRLFFRIPSDVNSVTVFCDDDENVIGIYVHIVMDGNDDGGRVTKAPVSVNTMPPGPSPTRRPSTSPPTTEVIDLTPPPTPAGTADASATPVPTAVATGGTPAPTVVATGGSPVPTVVATGGTPVPTVAVVGTAAPTVVATGGTPAPSAATMGTASPTVVATGGTPAPSVAMMGTAAPTATTSGTAPPATAAPTTTSGTAPPATAAPTAATTASTFPSVPTGGTSAGM